MSKKMVDFHNSSCTLCKQIMDDKLPDEFIVKSGIRNRIFAHSTNFLSIPSISPITAGHVLILPKFHIKSIAQVDATYHYELISFVTEIIELIKTIFDIPIIFEHGIGEGKIGGCGVDHAHLHIIPIGLNIGKSAAKKLHILYNTKSTSLIDFLKITNKQESYLFYGLDINNIDYIHDDIIPSQLLRKLIAGRIGKSHWDWKELYGWHDFRNTYFALLNQNLSKIK